MVRSGNQKGIFGMKLFIADDHDLVRDTIASFLRAEGVTTVRTGANLADALRAMANETFDLVLLDYHMPGMNGLEGVVQAVAVAAGKPVAVLSGSTSLDLAEAALRAGAVGFVPKTLAAAAMVSAIRQMAGGGTFAPLGLLHSDTTGIEATANLTRREADVLRGICGGKSNKEIARDLDLQEVTVKLHVKTLSRKLGAKNRTHAAMIARDAKIP